jgi:hypothetical protein
VDLNRSESSSGICPRPRSRRAAEPDNNPPHLGQAHHARAGQTHPGLATEREPRRASVSNSGSPRARRQPTARAVLNRARGAAYRPNGSPVRRTITSTSSRADRACPERARCSQSANGRLRDAVGAGQLCLRGTLREALHRLPALMGCERRRATSWITYPNWGSHILEVCGTEGAAADGRRGVQTDYRVHPRNYYRISRW